MWSAIRWIVLRLIALRWFFKLGWLGLLVPIAMILKVIGLPLLAVLSVIALLFLFGLPIFLVLAVGGLIMGALAFLLVIGVAALKFALFVVLPIWLVWMISSKLLSVVCRRRGDDPG